MTLRPAHLVRPHAMCAAIRHARKSLCHRLEQTAAESDEHFAQDFPAMVAAVEAGFRHEELLMETLGYERLREHREENAVILCALHRVMPQVEHGDLALGRQVLEALRDVLALHRLSSDLALAMAPQAQHMPARAHGKAARATQHVATHRRHVH